MPSSQVLSILLTLPQILTWTVLVLVMAAAEVLPASRWSTPMPRVGVRLRQRQAQNPVRPANTTRPRDTSGSRNWHLHKSVHTCAHTQKERCGVGVSQLLRSSFTQRLMHDRRSCPHWRQCIIQHHILVIINALCGTEAKSGANFLTASCISWPLNKGKKLWLNLQVRSMSSPLLWFPGSLYLGVNCWGRVKLRHSSTILASERGCLHKGPVSEQVTETLINF